jgi:general secretion pathway protein A
MTTTPLYLSHFGLSGPPFAKNVADGELWVPPTKEELVAELLEAIAAHESVHLVGEPGVGKTCVLRALRHRIPPQGFRLTYCHNVTLGRRDFYRQLCLALGLAPAATAGALFHAVSTHVQQLNTDRQHPVFLLDEAHLLHQDTLDHLHILLNHDWDSQPLLSVVLIGLPELADRLALRRNRSLYSRLARRLRIDPLTPDDTGAYIRMRMRRAGCEREVFCTDAIAMLHEAATGAMRDLDRLAQAALREGARKKRRLIERDLIQRVLHQDAPSS